MMAPIYPIGTEDSQNRAETHTWNQLNPEIFKTES